MIVSYIPTVPNSKYFRMILQITEDDDPQEDIDQYGDMLMLPLTSFT